MLYEIFEQFLSKEYKNIEIHCIFQETDFYPLMDHPGPMRVALKASELAYFP